MPLALNAIWKKFCVLQKKVLSFGPNRTVEVRPNRAFGRSLIQGTKLYKWMFCLWNLWQLRRIWMPYISLFKTRRKMQCRWLCRILRYDWKRIPKDMEFYFGTRHSIYIKISCIINGWWHWFGSVVYYRLFWFLLNHHRVAQ